MGADPRFHPAAGPFSLAEVAAAAGAALPDGVDAARALTGVAALDAAGPGEVAFLDGKRHRDAARATRAGAVLLARAEADALAPGGGGPVALVVRNPHLAYARVAALFHPAPAPRPGVHPTAAVHPSARLGEGCEVGPHAVVGEGAELGPGCVLGPHAVVGPGCVFGAGSRLHAHASAHFALAGAGVVLHEGARVGGEGFGFVPDPDAPGRFVTVPQLGRVVLGDGAQVGCNACVDRGALGDTVLGAGTRLDNLVMLGHNVRTGRGCVLVAQSGVAGSTTLGDHVTIAAQAGAAGHLTIGHRARVGAQSGVMRDVPDGTDVVGSPALPVREHMRAHATLLRLAATGRADPSGRAGRPPREGGTGP